MRNLLIMCDNFPPQSGPRMGNLCKYIREYEWLPYVVSGTSSRRDTDALEGYAKEAYLIPPKRHRRWNPLHLVPYLTSCDYLRNELLMRRTALEIATRVHFDMVLSCVSFTYFPAMSGSYVAKRLGVPHMIDVRDMGAQLPKRRECEGKPRYEIEERLLSVLSRVCGRPRRVRRLFAEADALSSVSPWHVEQLSALNGKVSLIYNGYNPDLFRQESPLRTGTFDVVYAGTLGGGDVLRNYHDLFGAVRRMHDKGEISPADFRIKFYSGNVVNMPIKDHVHSYGIDAYVEFLPFVQLSEIPALFRKASVLLQLGNSSAETGMHGIMTTKFFEYLAANRPILYTRSDGECLEAVMRETKSGFPAHSRDQVEGFLLDRYSEWKANGVTVGTADLKEMSKYSRRRQAKQFADIFNRLVDSARMSHSRQ